MDMVDPDFSRELDKLSFEAAFLSVFPKDVEETDFFKDLVDNAGDCSDDEDGGRAPANNSVCVFTDIDDPLFSRLLDKLNFEAALFKDLPKDVDETDFFKDFIFNP